MFLTAIYDCVGGDLCRMRKLSGTWILLLVLTIRLLGQVSAQSGIAHATFYGGADATGTNGIALLHNLHLYRRVHVMTFDGNYSFVLLMLSIWKSKIDHKPGRTQLPGKTHVG